MNQDRTLRCAGKAQDKSSFDTLMLKFRPIAPKPSTTGQTYVAADTSTRRKKRKYVRVSKNIKEATCRSKNGVRSVSTDPDNEREDIVTLQLLPERSTPLNNLDQTVETKTDTWLKFNGVHPSPLETWVTVESVNVGSVSYAIRCTDEEIADALYKDTCPGFISDKSNGVAMVNEAYRNMITGDDGGEVVVWLVVDETETFCDFRAFTCKVRLEYTWREMKYIKMVPCEVMKMQFGGFAWRLDISQALTLWL